MKQIIKEEVEQVRVCVDSVSKVLEYTNYADPVDNVHTTNLGLANVLASCAQALQNIETHIEKDLTLKE